MTNLGDLADMLLSTGTPPQRDDIMHCITMPGNARFPKFPWFMVFSKRHHDVAASVGRMEQRSVQPLADVLALAHADPWLWQPKTSR